MSRAVGTLTRRRGHAFRLIGEAVVIGVVVFAVAFAACWIVRLAVRL